MDAVLSQLQADGDAIADADARRLSPLVHKHLNFLGRYHFSLPGDVRGGELRELRDPNAGLEEEWLLPGRQPLAYIPVPLLLRPQSGPFRRNKICRGRDFGAALLAVI